MAQQISQQQDDGWMIPVYREGYTNPWYSDPWMQDPAGDSWFRSDPNWPPPLQQQQSSWPSRHRTWPPPPTMGQQQQMQTPPPPLQPPATFGGRSGATQSPFSADMDKRWQQWMNQPFPFHAPGTFKPGSGPSGLAPVEDDKSYAVKIDAKSYAPNEITVKTMQRDGHNFLMVEGKHETNDKQGYHSVHHFRRQFMLPQNVSPDKLQSKLNPDGWLQIRAPKDLAIEGTGVRSIPIQSS